MWDKIISSNLGQHIVDIFYFENLLVNLLVYLYGIYLFTSHLWCIIP